MTTKEMLILARARIADPANWCQKTYAKDDEGNPVRARSKEACQWCAIGAVLAVGAHEVSSWPAERALAGAADAVSGCPASVANYNDTHTHAEVLALYDHAIATVEERVTY